MTEELATLLKKFNPPQKEAATSTIGPTLVIAGAGSGKTSVLTARIALLLEQGILPERILALTFTKKAAEEMRSRITALAGEDARRLKMGTFHSVFISLLRPWAGVLGFPPNFTILDEEDSGKCLRRCIDKVLGVENRPPEEEMTKEDKEYFDNIDARYKLKTIRSRISLCKNDLMTADMYARNPAISAKDNYDKRPLMGKIFTEYTATCFRCGVMDFDDILLYTDMLMANNPEISRRIAASFDYILVDEYQDTNKAQYNILKRLTAQNDNICVVGDDSQSIYAFRGARIRNILNFRKEFKNCRLIKLEQNYRSTREIVENANRLIAHNNEKIEKTCFSEGEEGESTELIELPTANAEAYNITLELTERKRKKGLACKDFAILYRTNAQSRLIEEWLVKRNIPYVVYSGASFYERAEIKDQMAYFKMALNPNDDESFRRAVNRPGRGVGQKAMEQISAFASSYGLSLWNAINHPFFTISGNRTAAGVDSFRKTIWSCMEAAQTMKAHDAARHIADEAGLYEQYMKDNSQESVNRADNIRELIDAAQTWEKDTETRNQGLKEEDREDTSLLGFLQNAMLMSNADTGGTDGDSVSLMTVHCAKGLEFDTVFVAGMEDGLFPLKIEESDAALEEERRLFYVAATRAKNKLFLTRAESRMKFGKTQKTKPSQFITELMGELEYEQQKL